MEIVDLSNSIKEQYNSLHNFFNTIMEQQKAIINNDIAGIERSIKAEGALLIDIKQKEKRVNEIIGGLSDKYSLNPESGNLSDFIYAAKRRPDVNLSVISKLHEALKKMIVQIIEVNNQNKLLILQARSFIKQFVASLKLNNNSTLDRKM